MRDFPFGSQSAFVSLHWNGFLHRGSMAPSSRDHRSVYVYRDWMPCSQTRLIMLMECGTNSASRPAGLEGPHVRTRCESVAVETEWQWDPFGRVNMDTNLWRSGDVIRPARSSSFVAFIFGSAVPVSFFPSQSLCFMEGCSGTLTGFLPFSWTVKS